ncbi:MAG: M56 family metallopeptidase [Bacteroidales bacterium]
MIAYLIRSGVCMVLLFGLYHLILRKEKLFSFNRFYLIFAVVFSLAVPFVSIPVEFGFGSAAGEIAETLNNIQLLNSPEYHGVTVQENSIAEETIFTEPAVTGAMPVPVQEQAGNGGIMVILLIIYMAGLTLMAARFLRNILVVQRMLRRAETIDQKWYRIALLDGLASPFSFLRTVFLDRKAYLKNRIPANVLRHELEHIRQAHSRDVIFFELMNMIFWFNPMLYLFGRAARINHEYLADEAVVRDSRDPETYEGELISFIRCKASVPFTCGLNSSMIKDRLLMLNTVTSVPGRKIRAAVVSVLSVLLLTLLSLRPAYPGTQDERNRKKLLRAEDIVIEDVYFRDPGFKPVKSLVVIDGKPLSLSDTVIFDPGQVKTMSVRQGRDAIRKHGREAKGGAVEITTYQNDLKSDPDSNYFKPTWTVNNRVPEGLVSIPVSNLRSLSLWTYPVFPEQDRIRRWRIVDIMTRDYYRVKGKVLRINGEPFPGVKISATRNPFAATSDKDGRFLLEDVGEDAVVTVTGEGCEPLYFKVSGIIYGSDLKITLDRNREPDFNLDLENHLARDFTGRWKINKEQSLRQDVRVDDVIYDIRQYGSDSILIRESRTLNNGREFKSKSSFVFNTIRKEDSGDFSAIESTLICTVPPDGKSFSVTMKMKSKIGVFEDSEYKVDYSLSDDGNQLIERITGKPGASVIPAMIFDRIREEE